MPLLSKKTSGFTLIELMIVVAIIAILAALALPKFSNLIVNAKEANIKKSLGALRGALSIYYSDNQINPSELTISLTTDSKYIASIPSITIPQNSDFGNTGHAQTSGNTATLDDMATGAWLYINNDRDAEIHVNCSHSDLKGNAWSEF